ncbi:hypothetical protein OIU34_18945 [Pararhizobium sp. BT-229]|uniref:hypothetical protein n=1 Tax=Pararhizobium sp. BT-229 TaxID=2986923 RepID=UPI0021F77A05|nr:hypothetical protein [Pararhizobium sp. BT-229]MCV9963959.1 hypothetical protein [Pararhizobium sp. BT-229]
MIDNGQFEVRKPVLWFRAIGKTIPDGLVGLVEQSITVYETSLARPGDLFYLVEGALVHQGRDGSLSLGAFNLRNQKGDNAREGFLLTKHNDLALKSILNTPARIPVVPVGKFPASHCGVVRPDLSPAFAEMLEATEEFRHDCDQDGAWTVDCTDYGITRAISFSVHDVETQISLVRIEYSPISRSAVVTVADREFASAVIGSLRDVGITISDEGVADDHAWDADAWRASQSALSKLFFRRSATPSLAMAG